MLRTEPLRVSALRVSIPDATASGLRPPRYAWRSLPTYLVIRRRSNDGGKGERRGSR